MALRVPPEPTRYTGAGLTFHADAQQLRLLLVALLHDRDEQARGPEWEGTVLYARFYAREKA